MPILRFFFFYLIQRAWKTQWVQSFFIAGIKEFFQPFMVNKNSIPKSEIKSADADNAWKPK